MANHCRTQNSIQPSVSTLMIIEESKEFCSTLFHLLPGATQKNIDVLAEVTHRVRSPEPQVVSQDNKVTSSLIDLQILQTRQLNGKFGLIAEESDEVRNDLGSLKEANVEDLQKKLTSLLSAKDMHRMKLNDYGKNEMPRIRFLADLKTQLAERDALRAELAELRRGGKLYEGIEDFKVDSIERMIRKAENEKNNLLAMEGAAVNKVQTPPDITAEGRTEDAEVENEIAGTENGGGVTTNRIDEYSYTQREHFTSEIYKIEVSNLPFHMAPSDFKKLLTKRLSLQPHKIKMFNISRSRFAFLTFKNEQLRDNAVKIIDGYKYKQNVLQATLAKPRADPVQKAKKRAAGADQDGPPEKKSILDIVIPWHAMDYEEQLKLKQESMDRLLLKLGEDLGRQQNQDFNETIRALKKANQDRKSICRICPICRSPRTEFYRNKNEFTPGRDDTGTVVVGFRKTSYKKGSIEVGGVSEDMRHVPPLAVRVTQFFEGYFRGCAELRPPYNPELEEGYWRQLTVRTSENEQCMVIVLMHPQSLTQDEIQTEKDKLTVFHQTDLHESVTSLYFQLFDKRGNDYPFEHLAGSPIIEEKLFGLTFEISPPSFFQVNTKAAEILYGRVADLASVTKDTTVLDLFCGTGSIGLSMAHRAKRIVGAEIIPEAVTNARKVAERHGISNAEFITGKAEDVLSLAMSKVAGERDIVAIVDPPRQGVHNRVVKLLRGNPKISRIVYVACNPTAAMQNILDFCKQPSNNYRGQPFVPIDAQPVDMFPHTPHTELIVCLRRLDLVKADLEASLKSAETVEQPPGADNCS